MALLTVEQAAHRLNRTPRTIRRWITEEHKLTEYHPPHGHTEKFLIDESEVEALAAELAKYEQAKPEPAKEDTISLIERITQLERRVSELESLLTVSDEDALARADRAIHETSLISGYVTEQENKAAWQKSPKKLGRPSGSVTPIETPKEIPSGSVSYAIFAEKHGVNERTARGQIDKGYIPAFVRAKPSNPRFKERWLTPAHQQEAIQFWQSHETRGFTPCYDCPHEQYQEENNVLE